MLQSSIQDIKSLSLMNTDAQKINKTSQFWYDKIVTDGLPIVSNVYNKK